MDAAELAACWASVKSAVEEHAKFPPGALDVSVWSDVATGKVARPKGADITVGIGVIAAGRAASWLAITDDTPDVAVRGLTQFPLSGRWTSEKWLYQLIDLPWPLADRHWVLHSTNSRELAESSTAWERSWTLAPEWMPRARDQVGAERFDAAVTTPINEGSWILVPVDGANTLGIYQARADLGGKVPAGAADAYSATTLPSLFSTTTTNARSMTRRYGPDCTPERGADGGLIPCFPQ